MLILECTNYKYYIQIKQQAFKPEETPKYKQNDKTDMFFIYTYLISDIRGQGEKF